MARLFEMNWRGAPHYDWRRMYKGRTYRVSCDELRAVVRTKEGSAKLANDWWRKKRAEVDGNDPAARHLAHLEATAQEKVQENIRLAYVDPLHDLLSQDNHPTVTQAILERIGPAMLNASKQAAATFQPVAGDRSIARLVDLWLETEAGRMRAGKLGENRLANNRIVINHFRDWVGANTPVDVLNEQKWLECHAWLSRQVEGGKWSVAHADRIFSVARRFMKFCWELRLIELPRNLDNRGLAFTVPPREIQTFTVEEVRRLYQGTGGQSKLHLLLMLNCGFQGMDIATLRHDEVDWSEGVITRKRTKTKGQKNVPTVRYKLWPETFELLKQWRSRDPEIVLLTLKGNRWIQERTKEDGRLSKSDMVGRNLDYWLERCGIERAPKQLRATAASMLAQHPTYKFYTAYFLGHSPQGVAEKHYVRPSDAEFFQATDWLREKLLGQ